jgi:hypothetical protein
VSFAEKVRKVISKQWDIPIPPGDCGIEIEIEGDGLPQGRITKAFSGKGDGSLRNGAEYVSIPIPRKDVGVEVDRLRAALEKAGSRFQPSYRCSTHIHENYADKTFHDVLGAYVVWALIEPTIFRAIPAGRDGSLFCVPSYDTGDIPGFIERVCKDISNDFRSGFQPRGKYASQNITRLGPGEHHALGTLEYRIFPYSMDGETVQTWCDWLGAIKDVVSEAKDETFLSLVRYAEQNPIPFLSRVFGKCPVPKEDAGSLVDFGARQAYEIARVINAAYKMKAKAEPAKKKSFLNIPAGEINPIMEGFINDFVEVAPAEPVNPFPRAPDAPRVAVGAAGQRRPIGAARRRAQRDGERAAQQRVLEAGRRRFPG